MTKQTIAVKTNGTLEIEMEEKKIEHKIPELKVEVSENQLKAIKDKYLRDDPSIEYWLWNVAYNIALADLFYDPLVSKDQILYGVKHISEKKSIRNTLSTELLLIHAHARNYNEQEQNHKSFIQNLYKIAESNEYAAELVYNTASKFYKMLANWEFLPNSPTLMNAGRELQQLSACYVLPVLDSIEGWGDLVKATMLIHKSGGGTGFSGCRVRPKGDRVKSTKGIASGALSPFHIINYATQEVKQGGTRRGANMGILPYWHPDIFEFITAKAKEGVLENFNVSVAVDKKFMEAVKNDSQIEILNPRNKEVVKILPAKEMFDLITEYAWKTGDPGVVFIDTINNSLSNPTPELGEVEATNPCGEQPLLPFEPCNLGSINLSKFVKEGNVEWERLGETVKLATKFLDNVIDVNNYPLPEIEAIAKGNRRIGLGVMGWAEMLVLLGMAYDSNDAIITSEKVMKFVNEKSLEASEELAIHRGIFPNFQNSIYDKEGSNHKEYGIGKPRNCARTTIAPTGTIALAAGLQGSGIEPFFAIAYERYNAKALDALKKGEQPNESDVFHEVNPLFRKTAVEYEFFGLEETELWRKIEVNHKSARSIKEIPEHIQKIFASAHDIHVDWHVKHQSGFQKYVDNGVSKTINLPNSATVDDIKRTYLMAYETSCKGITVYRDGCKSQQVLNLTSAVDKKKEQTTKKIDFSEGLSSKYYKYETGYGPVHIHIDHTNGEALRIFANTTPVGTEIAGLTTALGIMISKYLENGGNLIEIRKQLNSIKSDKSHGFGPNRIESIPHAVSVAITKFLREHGKIQDPQQSDLALHIKQENGSANGTNGNATGIYSNELQINSNVNPQQQLHCPKCYSPNIAFVSGCSGPTCFDCGHSQCS